MAALTTEATVQFISCPVTKTIAMSLGKNLYVSRYDTSSGRPLACATWSSPIADDDIRAVAFVPVESSTADPLLYVAGDAKFVRVVKPFDGNSARKDSAAMTLSTYGPHQKKVQVMVPFPPSKATGGTDGSQVLLADKFGDVFIHTLKGSGASAVFVEGEPAFAMQHLSIFTTLHLLQAGSTSGSQRLVSCDRDNHVRVSRFPDVHYIDNFLWGERPQSNVAVMAHFKVKNSTNIRMALGHACGRVSIWELQDTTSQSQDAGSHENPLEKLIVTYPADVNKGSVSGIVAVEEKSGEQYFLVSYERDSNLWNLEKKSVVACPKEHGEVVATTYLGNGVTAVLQRSGDFELVNGTNVVTRPAGNDDVFRNILTSQAVAQVLSQVEIHGLWDQPAMDPRSRKKRAEGEGEDEDDGEGGEEESQRNKRKRSPTNN